MKRRLLLLSFVEGAAVMCAELCGARLAAPLFGSSLYVWAAIMGFTLAALAGGYFFGGLYSGGGAEKRVLRRALLLAAFYLLLMPQLARFILPPLSQFDFMPAMLCSVALLLLPPVFLLGASSPLFIALQTGDAPSAGKVSGTVYAVSTAGGIVSTFVCGFYLIPEKGLNFTLLLHGGLLLALTLVNLRGRQAGFAIVTGGLLLAIGSMRGADRAVYVEDGIHGRVEVVDLVENNRSLRRLLVNGIIQTEIDLADSSTTMQYVNMLDTLLPLAAGDGRALVLGTGGGSVVKMLDDKGYRCVAVEFDERVMEAAKKYFFIPPSAELIRNDARHFLNSCRQRFDLILVDVFKAEEQPSHVLTTESLARLKTLMNPQATLIVNWHGYDKGDIGLGTELLLNTLAHAGLTIQVFYTGPYQDYRNTLIFARTGPGARGASGFVNMDDRPRMEKYNALANMTWRMNYLRYYRSATAQ